MVTAVVFGYIKNYVDGESGKIVGMKSIFRWLKSDFWRILLATFVMGLLALLLVVLVMLIPILGAFANMFLVIFILGFMYITSMIMVYERKGFFNSFARSFDLLSNFWWATFGILAVVSIIQITLSNSVSAPSILVYRLYVMHTLQNSKEVMYSTPVMNALGAVLSGVAAIVVFLLHTITLIAMAFQYFNLVERKEGRGLMEKIQRIGSLQFENEDEPH